MGKLDSWLKSKLTGEENANEKQQKNPHNKSDNTKPQKNAVANTNKPSNRNFTKRNQPHKKGPGRGKSSPIRVFALGGLEEIGKNMTVFEYEDNILIVDMGLQFPDENMLGIDYLIPDTRYLEKNKHKIRGVIITHGHLDHIGGIAHILPKLGFPTIYATRLTNGLIQKRIEEFSLEKQAKLQTLAFGQKAKLGPFLIELFRVNHSIPDGAGIFIKTPAGNLVHSGDFKFDFTPADNEPADFGRIAQIGKEGVLAAFVDSTNSTKPGFTPSEKNIGKTIESIVRDAKGRVIISLFSTQISRIQQIFDAAHLCNRKVFISGRSLVDNTEIAQNLHYLKSHRGLAKKLNNEANKLPDNKVLVITTGSQGEANAALNRIAMGEHNILSLKHNDTVVLSSSPIAGNERSIQSLIDKLCAKGAKVISNSAMDVHVTGHAHQEDIKLMHSLLRPKYLIPVHGQLYMRIAHREVAKQVGIAHRNVILANNGEVIEITKNSAHKTRQKIPLDLVVIDGHGVGTTGPDILLDRQVMANNGVFNVIFKVEKKGQKLMGEPQIVSKGFLYPTELHKIEKEAQKRAIKAYNDILESTQNFTDEQIIAKVKNQLERFFIKKLNREPMILPILVRM